jgi:hypothetical protein
MLFLALISSALAVCTLPDDIDPNLKCVEDANGFSTLDADSDEAIPISLTISAKAETVDAFRTTHPGTSGTLTDDTETDGRYILACPQAEGKKTVQFNVFRPAHLTAFGTEWVQLFPKDSWENVTNEFEPFTFNDWGAKVPLTEFRPTTTGLTNDPDSEDVLHVFMEVKDEGDYEVKFGNPYLQSDEKWVAVEFKSTILRVGAPWADCSGTSLDEAAYEVGSIMPILFGGPNLNSVALKGGFPSYTDVIDELSSVAVPVKVVLEVFNADKTSYTSSGEDLQCYRAGNVCPEAHKVCEPQFCEMDVWAQIIADLKAASPGKVSVLGSVGVSTTASQYAALDMDGFYFVGVPAEDTAPGTSVAAIGAPLFDEDTVDDATVYVTLASPELGLWNPFSWYPYVSPSKWAAIVTDAYDTSAIATLVDRGYGWVYLTSEVGFDTHSSITAAVLDELEAISTTRRLQGRRLQASEPFWGCDDTLFECKPICMRQIGLVTAKVADGLCFAAPIDQCGCKCYHETQWSCEGEAVVCKARHGAGHLKTVGDRVCQTRGASKPKSVAELRVSSQCEPMKKMRGSAPTAECLAKWTESSKPAPTQAPEDPEDTAAAEDSASPEPPVAKIEILHEESLAAPALALAALAFYA